MPICAVKFEQLTNALLSATQGQKHIYKLVGCVIDDCILHVYKEVSDAMTFRRLNKEKQTS